MPSLTKLDGNPRLLSVLRSGVTSCISPLATKGAKSPCKPAMTETFTLCACSWASNWLVKVLESRGKKCTGTGALLRIDWNAVDSFTGENCVETRVILAACSGAWSDCDEATVAPGPSTRNTRLRAAHRNSAFVLNISKL